MLMVVSPGASTHRVNASTNERTNAGHGVWMGRHQDASVQAVDGNIVTSKCTGPRRVLARLADATDSQH